MSASPVDSKSRFVPIVMSGGSGTRLWPVSRKSHPKQFSELFGSGLQNSLYAQTIGRLAPLASDMSGPWTVTTRDLSVLTSKTLGELKLPNARVLLEPRGRNTAAAIALVCRALSETADGAGAIAGVFPADHRVENEGAFQAAVREAVRIVAADQAHVVTLGLKPTFPSTGYGYIEASERLQGSMVARRAVAFREKPDVKNASEFLQRGNFYWNAGMFFFKVSTMIELLKEHAPDVWNPLSSAQLNRDFSNLAECYEKVRAISIDYAVMEKLKSHVTIPCDFGWSDVGSWDAISDLRQSAAAISVDSANCFVQTTEQEAKTFALVGIRDVIVVDTKDALLIAHKGETEKVKAIVDELSKAKLSAEAKRATDHVFEVRPWGRFEILSDTESYKSKRIVVDPGAQISYQSHAKRTEHWIIVRGLGEVILNGETIAMKAGSHALIPQGAKHRIRNTGPEPLEFIEVQLGSYFGEDDIVRYEDTYGRE